MSFDNGSSGSGSIAGADDVVLSNPADKQLLTYDFASKKWENADPAVTPGDLDTKVDKGALVVSVLDTGARCDGTTDDTAAVQAALDSVQLNGGIVVIPPTKTCVVTALSLARRVTLQVSAGATLLRPAGSTETGPLLLLNKNDAKVTGGGYITAANASPQGIVRIDGAGANTEWCRVTDVHLSGAGATTDIGVVLSGTSTFQNVLSRVTVNDVGIGIQMTGGANSNHLTDCTLYHIGVAGYDFDGTLESTVLGGSVLSAIGVTVLRLRSGAFYNRIMGVIAEPGVPATFYTIESDCHHNQIIGGSDNTSISGSDDGTDNLLMLKNGIVSPSLIGPVTDKGGQVCNVMAYGARGDGTTDDTTAIQAAIDAAAATGSSAATVLLPYTAAGYAVASTVTVPDGVTLRGERQVALKKTGASAASWIDCSGAASLIDLTINLNNLISVRAVRFMTGAGGRVRHCIFTDTATSGGIYAIQTFVVGTTAVSDLIIDDCDFDGVRAPIFLDRGPTNVTVSNCRLRNWSMRGIYLLSTTTYAATDILLAGNRFTDCIGTAADVRQPIQIVGDDSNLHKNIRISCNVAIGSYHSYTNTTTPGTADLISIHRTDGFVIEGNICRGSGDVGITIAQQCVNGVVSGNMCEGNDTVGISLGSASSTYVKAITAAGNTCLNNGRNEQGDRPARAVAGILANLAQYCTISGNTCTDTQATKTQVNAVSFANCTNVNYAPGVDSGNAAAAIYQEGTNTGCTKVVPVAL